MSVPSRALSPSLTRRCFLSTLLASSATALIPSTADAEESSGGDVEVYQTDTGFFVSAPDGTTAEVVFTDDGFSIYGDDGLSVDSSTAEAPIPGELASKSKGGYEIESVPAGYEVL